MSVRVSITGGERMKEALQKIVDTKLAVKAGIPAGATTTDGKSIPEYAMYNEVGTAHIPPRPFMRDTVNDKQDNWKSFLESNVDYNNIQRDKCVSVMGVLGEVMVADIKQTIQKGGNPPFAPNAEATRKAKERRGKSEANHPLIDTGQMLESIISEVVK
jgi:hypothetical protein